MTKRIGVDKEYVVSGLLGTFVALLLIWIFG